MRVFFMGTPELAVPTLAALGERHELVGVATQPDRRRGRGRKSSFGPVKQWAIEHDVPVHQPATLRDPVAVSAIAATAPDAIVVVAYGLILPAEVLAIPHLGCVNVHASLLPRYRGASPIQAAILAGDVETGVTTMLMDEGLDTGPLLLRQRLDLRGDETAGELGVALGELGADLAVATLDALACGGLEPQPQDPDAATMTGLARKQDGCIDWTREAAHIERQVRAMQPWPSAWTEWQGMRLQLWRVKLTGAAPAPPGQVIEAGPELVVACGDGAIVVQELQKAGGKRLASADFLRGTPMRVGDRMGIAK